MQLRSYILAGIAAYLIFVITSIPASLVINVFGEQLPVQVSNISGTLWNGQAGKIGNRKGLTLTQAHWSVVPWHLLLGKLSYDVNAKYNNAAVSPRLSASLLGKLTVQDLKLTLEAPDMASMIALPVGELSGNFNIHVNQARWSKGTVPAINGVIKWDEAAITITETADLGNVSLILSEAEQMPFQARISNNGGDLSLQGQLSTTKNGTYTLELTMKPTASASNNLVNSMSMFSKKQANGSYLFNNTGNLQQLGLM